MKPRKTKFLTTAQAAKKLECGVSTVRLMIADGRIKAEKHGRDWLIKESDLEGISVPPRGRPARSNPVKL